jgi:hypothetical protein
MPCFDLVRHQTTGDCIAILGQSSEMIKIRPCGDANFSENLTEAAGSTDRSHRTNDVLKRIACLSSSVGADTDVASMERAGTP